MLEKYKFCYRLFLGIFWGSMCWGFVTQEFLPFLIPLTKAFNALVEVAVLIFGLALLKDTKDKIVVVSFVLISFISTFLLNRLSMFSYLMGVRDFIGLIAVYPILRFFLTGENAQYFKANFDKQLRFWLWVQAFCLVWQFIRYGANDAGGGSMGYGASGMVSMLIYLISFYLSLQNWDFNDYFGSIRRNKWNLILLLPTYLNETKISFILLGLYFILLYKPTRSALVKFVYVIPVLIALGAGLITLYLRTTNQDSDYVLSWQFVNDYFNGDDIDELIEVALLIQDGYFDDDLEYENLVWVLDLPRVSKLKLVMEPLSKTPGGIWMGAGVGQLKGETTGAANEFSRKYKWLLQGTRPWSFTVIVQIGLIGMIWFLWSFISECFCGVNYNRRIKRLYIFIGICTFLMLIYNEAFRYCYFCIPFFYLIFAIRLYKPNENEQLAYAT